MPHYLEFEVSLQHTQPRVWRRFQHHESGSFADLNRAIQDAFGWHYAHLWEFRTGGRRPRTLCTMSSEFASPWTEPAPEAHAVPLGSFFKRVGSKCIYVYDFGDNWEHEVKLKQRLESTEVFWRRLTGGRRTGPPEDCGGVWGYEYLVELSEADPETLDDEALERLEWVGEDWKPDDYDWKHAAKRFDKLELPERARSFRPTGGASEPAPTPSSPVVAMCQNAMELLGLNERQLQNAEKLWTDYIRKTGKSRRKDSTNAAGVVYCIGTLDFTSLTQADVGDALGVSPGALSKAYRHMWEVLDLDNQRESYATVSHPEDRWKQSQMASILRQLQGLNDELVLDPALEEVLSALPQHKAVWVFGAHLMPVAVEELGGARPRALVILDGQSGIPLGLALGSELQHEGQEALDLLVTTVQHPATGPAHRPSKLLVNSEVLHASLEEVMTQLDIEVLMGPQELYNELFSSMESFFEEQQSPAVSNVSHFDAQGVSPELVGPFYQAAARFAELAPWEKIDDAPYFAIELHRWGFERVCVSIVGRAEESFGVLFFRSSEDYTTFYHMGLQTPGGLMLAGELPHVSFLALNYGPPEFLGETRHKEVLSHHFEVVAPHLYPDLMSASFPHGQEELDASAYRAATACLELLTAYLESKGLRFLKLDGQPQRAAFEALGETFEVIVPHPDFEWD